MIGAYEAKLGVSTTKEIENQQGDSLNMATFVQFSRNGFEKIRW
jgi:hypothetical protein